MIGWGHVSFEWLGGPKWTFGRHIANQLPTGISGGSVSYTTITMRRRLVRFSKWTFAKQKNPLEDICCATTKLSFPGSPCDTLCTVHFAQLYFDAPNRVFQKYQVYTAIGPKWTSRVGRGMHSLQREDIWRDWLRQDQRLFSKCISHCLCLLYLSLSLSFCWQRNIP